MWLATSNLGLVGAHGGAHAWESDLRCPLHPRPLCIWSMRRVSRCADRAPAKPLSTPHVPRLLHMSPVLQLQLYDQYGYTVPQLYSRSV